MSYEIVYTSTNGCYVKQIGDHGFSVFNPEGYFLGEAITLERARKIADD